MKRNLYLEYVNHVNKKLLLNISVIIDKTCVSQNLKPLKKYERIMLFNKMMLYTINNNHNSNFLRGLLNVHGG